jgi:hypothetical protein
MSKNIRIRTTPNGEDSYLKVKLEQDFDFLEVLSLKISQEETYKNFCSDYGVVVGRVTVSSGFGVPNAKVSIFVPISDDDALDPELNGFYPYEVITDKNIDGIRYNLFPKTSETDNECFTPIGTFPTKREVLDNEIMTEIYSRYYKFTTTTNHAGDFMIFGVPVGTYVLHIDADMSDVGIISQRPYDSISQGTPTKFFESPTKYKGGTNLDSLVQVKSVNIGINVQPFWGSQENCEIGITRIDTDLNYTIVPSAIFMGSLFGDSDKHSVNKNCRPRKALGELCEQVAGEGTIEMIRETIDGTIEQFDVEGGRVIDKDGSWAYQIPMNLDYMMTDEFGNLVLSDNPNVGLPTRANVRFRIGMDETGGTGRLRTRAKYLVPHNPTKGRQDEIDYGFGVNTKPTSFRTLYWNKIYTVNNFISRFQTNNNVETRAITGIKDVDSCVGTKNPFPFNKVNTGLSPIFFIICLLIKIIGSVVWIFNSLIVAGINALLKAWNSLMEAFCSVSRKKILKIRIFGFLEFTCKLIIPYIECIGMKCPFDGDGVVYAPGCKKDSEGFKAMTEQPTYYPNDGCHSTGFLDLAGLDDCVSAVMAEELNIFQFDFYNDWVNGSLYNFLIKYKRRKNTNGKFCEYECDSFASSTNDCHSNYLVDICYDGGDDSEDKSYNTSIREGLIKKVGDEFYYAASTHNAVFKMFATDIVSLGSVFNCDWQGIPKIQQYFIPTTYKIPPIVQELLQGSTEVETTGQFDTSGCRVNGNKNGLFFDINCLGVHSNYSNCLNIRHLCEFGVELDEYRFSSDGTPISCDRLISVTDIDTDDNGGKRVRDVFYGLNKTKNNFEMNFPYTTNFSTSVPALPTYDFTSYANNGIDYIDFRGYTINSQNIFSQPNNSFFFYFGLTPNNTGLDKMNQRFFTKCVPVTEKEFLITVKTTSTSRNTTNDGTMIFKFVNGTAPFTYSISGQGGYNNQGTSDGSEITIYNLAVGQYQITGIDDLENTVVQNFTISGPPRLFSEAFVSKNATTNVVSDGEITISQVGGGTGTYFYQLLDNLGGTVRPITNLINTPTTLTNLPINILTDGQNPPNYGYKLVVTDSDSNNYTILNLPISGPVVLNAAVTKTDVTCFDGFNGVIRMNITGGQVPYTTTTTGPISGGVPYESTNKDMFNLEKGTYVTTIIDSQSHSLVVTTNIRPITGELKIIKPSSSDLLDGQDSTGSTYSVAIKVVAGGVSGQQVKIKYNLDDAMNDDGEMIWVTITQLFVDSIIPVRFDVPKSLLTELITIKIVNSGDTCESEEIEIEAREMIV